MTDHHRMISQKHAEELLEFSADRNVQELNIHPKKIFLEYIIEDNNKKRKQDNYITQNQRDFNKERQGRYKKSSKNIFHKLNKRSQSKIKNHIVADPIVKSSQRPIVTLSTGKNDKIHPKIDMISNLSNERHVVSEYFIDLNNDDCYCVPLCEVVFPNTD